MASQADISSWIRRWNKRVKQLEKQVKREPKVVAEWGAKKAKTIAPRYTGALIQAISWKDIPKSKNGRAMIYVRDMTDASGRSVSRYAGIHHARPKGQEIPVTRFDPKTGKQVFTGQWRPVKSGDSHWLFTIRNEARERFRRGIIGHIQKFR